MILGGATGSFSSPASPASPPPKHLRSGSLSMPDVTAWFGRHRAVLAIAMQSLSPSLGASPITPSAVGF